MCGGQLEAGDWSRRLTPPVQMMTFLASNRRPLSVSILCSRRSVQRGSAHSHRSPPGNRSRREEQNALAHRRRPAVHARAAGDNQAPARPQSCSRDRARGLPGSAGRHGPVSDRDGSVIGAMPPNSSRAIRAVLAPSSATPSAATHRRPSADNDDVRTLRLSFYPGQWVSGFRIALAMKLLS